MTYRCFTSSLLSTPSLCDPTTNAHHQNRPSTPSSQSTLPHSSPQPTHQPWTSDKPSHPSRRFVQARPQSISSLFPFFSFPELTSFPFHRSTTTYWSTTLLQISPMETEPLSTRLLSRSLREFSSFRVELDQSEGRDASSLERPSFF